MKRFVVVLALVACSSETDTSLSAVRAVDGERAVALFRTRGDRYTIGVIDSKGSVRWRSKVPGEPYSIGPDQGIAVVGEVVTVRYGHRVDRMTLDHALAGYSLRDGKLLWDTTIAKYEPRDLGEYGKSSPNLPTWISTVVVAGKLAVFTDTGATGHRFDVIDPATGKITATHPRGEHDSSYAPVVVGSHLFTHHVNQTKRYDVTGKPPVNLDTAYEGCVVGDEYIVVEHKNEVTELVAYKGGDIAQRRVIASPFQPTPKRSHYLRRCGTYRDRIVLLVQANESSDESAYVISVDALGKVLSTIDLDRDMLWDGPGSGHKHDPNVAPLGGELTRFVPFVQTTYSPDDSKRLDRLVMLDLEDGKIAWAAPNDERIIHMTLFRSGTRWLAFWPTLSWIVTTFDGATGEPTASKQLHVYDGVGDVRAYHAAGNRIWINGGTWTSASKPTIGVLDAGTLEPVSVRGIKITDVLAATKKSLGR